jgi:diamine N-acetyltransferase
LNSRFTIRHATLADAELLTALGARTFYDTFAIHNTARDMQEYLAESFNKEQQTAELLERGTLFLIAETDKGTGGYAMLRPGPPPNEIHLSHAIEVVRLYVDKEWLGLGVGSGLMQACLDESKEKGFKHLWLGVWEHNQRALAFYRKWEFETFGEHIFYVGADAQNDYLMRRRV